jgi:hypothetical protein
MEAISVGSEPRKVEVMTEAYARGKESDSAFGQMLAEKRAHAGLTLPQLAALSRLPIDLLEGIEYQGQPVSSFDVCEKIAQAINAHRALGLTARELWQAALTDKAARSSGAANTGSLR